MKKLTAWLSGSLFVVVVLSILAATSFQKYAIPEQALNLELRVKSDGQVQTVLYHDFRNEGRLYEEDVSPFVIPYAPNFTPMKFALPRLPIRFLRLDMNAPRGDVTLTDVRVTDEKGETVRAIKPAEIVSINPGATIVRQGEETVLRWQNAQGVPILWLNIEYPIHPLVNPHRVTAGAIAALWTVLGLLALAGAITILRGFLRPPPATAAKPDAWRPALMWLAATVLILVGAKLWLVNEYGSAIPHWDSWELEGWALFPQYLDGTLSWQVMFENINEHRVFFTRVWSLGLFLLSGQWDARLGMTVNVFLHAAVGLGLCVMLWQLFGRRHLVFLALLSLMAFALPFSWENTLWATQSQFYFLVLFSVPAIWLLGTHAPLTARWWIGLTLSVCCLFTVSSGSLAAAAVAGFMVLKLIRDRKRWRDPVITLAACGVVLVLGKHFAVTEKAHAGWFAGSFGDFLATFCKTGAFPMIEHPWLMPAMWLPFILLTIYYLAKKDDHDRLVEILMSLGIWMGVQVLAIGLFRGGGGAGPESRHMDSMCIGLVVNGAAALALIGRVQALRIPERFWAFFVPAWWVLSVVGLMSLSAQALLQDIPRWKAYNDRVANAVNTYLRGGDMAALMNTPDDSLPYVRYVLPSFLGNRHIRAMMPADVGEPLKVESSNPAAGMIRPNGVPPSLPVDPLRPTWGSFTPSGMQNAQASFSSKPLTPGRFPYLQVEVAGDVGDPGMLLGLRGLNSGKAFPLVPAVKPGLSWTKVLVKTPEEPFVIEVVDAHPGKWLAFRAPTGATRLCGWVERLLNRSRWLLFGGVALIVFSAVYVRVRRIALAPAAVAGRPTKKMA